MASVWHGSCINVCLVGSYDTAVACYETTHNGKYRTIGSRLSRSRAVRCVVGSVRTPPTGPAGESKVKISHTAGKEFGRWEGDNNRHENNTHDKKKVS